MTDTPISRLRQRMIKVLAKSTTNNLKTAINDFYRFAGEDIFIEDVIHNGKNDNAVRFIPLLRA